MIVKNPQELKIRYSILMNKKKFEIKWERKEGMVQAVRTSD